MSINKEPSHLLRSLFYDSTREGDVRRQSTYGWRVLDSAAYAFLNTATWNSEAGPSPSTRLLMCLGQPQWLHRTVGERFKDETVTQCGATKHGKSTEVFWKRCPDTQRGDKQLNTCSSSLVSDRTSPATSIPKPRAVCMAMIPVTAWQVTMHLLSQIKFYWNTAISIHLDPSMPTTSKMNSFNENSMTGRVKYIYYLALSKKKFAIFDSHSYLMIFILHS